MVEQLGPISLSQAIEAVLGARTRPRDNPEISQIGLTAGLFLRNNPTRLAFTISNLSTNNLFIGPFSDVSATKGYFVGPNGGSWIFNYTEDFHKVGYEWFVIASAAGSNFFVTEEVTS